MVVVFLPSILWNQNLYLVIIQFKRARTIVRNLLSSFYFFLNTFIYLFIFIFQHRDLNLARSWLTHRPFRTPVGPSGGPFRERSLRGAGSLAFILTGVVKEWAHSNFVPESYLSSCFGCFCEWGIKFPPFGWIDPETNPAEHFKRFFT